MLLEIEVEFEKIQVGTTPDETPPLCQIFGEKRCICCGRKLHGHGWRQRYFEDIDQQSLRLWIHRKLCPGCGITYTLLPKWVHTFKLHSVALIRRVLHMAFCTGHVGNQLRVSRPLQRLWKAQYIQRSSALENQLDPSRLVGQILKEPGSCLTSPPGLHELTTPLMGKMQAMQYKPPGAHHRLLLFIPSGLQ